MKALFSAFASTLSISFVLFSLQNPAIAAQDVEHTIKLTQIDPLGIAPHTFISDQYGNAVLANSGYQNYQISFDKGLTWKEIKYDRYFIPQEFSPINNTDVLGISIKSDTQEGTLDFSENNGLNWSHLKSKETNCPLNNIEQIGKIGEHIPSTVKFIPNHPYERLFVAPTTEGKYGVFYSDDSGISCKQTLSTSRSSLISVAKSGDMIFVTDKKTKTISYSPDGTNWKQKTLPDYPEGSSINISSQIQTPTATDVYNTPVEYVAYNTPSVSGIISFTVDDFEQNIWEAYIALTTLKGIKSISFTLDNKFFVIDSSNHFMLQDGSFYAHPVKFDELTETFTQGSASPDLSKWSFLSLDWLNPEHTKGIVNFINYDKSADQITYQFEIQ